MSKCEWNPERNEPAQEYRRVDGSILHLGCNNEAELSVGANGQWHLCRSCAALPRFKRFTSIKGLNKVDTADPTADLVKSETCEES